MPKTTKKQSPLKALDELTRNLNSADRELVTCAFYFASAAHGAIDQRRKYTGEPYITHPIAVAKRVAASDGATAAMIAAALLHDVVEDTELTLDMVAEHFSSEVTELVDWLTHVTTLEDGNRKVRMQIECDRVARAPAKAQTIKVCDLAHNSASILLHGGGFANVYIPEKADLLRVLNKCDATVYQEASDVVRHAIKKLGLKIQF